MPWWSRGAQLKVKFSGPCFLSPQSRTSSSLCSVHSEGEDCASRVQGFFPTELEAESATRPSGNQRLTGGKGEVRFLPEIEVRDMGGIQGFTRSILVLTGPMREAVGKYHSPVWKIPRSRPQKSTLGSHLPREATPSHGSRRRAR